MLAYVIYCILSLLGDLYQMKWGEGDEVLERVAQRGCGCLTPAGVQGQVGWGPGQPDLVGGSPFPT